MQFETTYGECLSSILEVLNLKVSKLAREINLDSSLIYKWLRNERVPSYESTYIEKIVDYILKKISNTHQKSALTNLLNKYGIFFEQTNNTDLGDMLRNLLYEAQGYSIRLNNAKKLAAKSKPGTNSLIKRINASIYAEHNKPKSGKTAEYIEKSASRNDCMQILKGRKEVTDSIIELLKMAYFRPSSSDKTILITYNCNKDNTVNDDTFGSACTNALNILMSYGWNIVLLLRLDHSARRTITVIETIQILLNNRDISIYYHEGYNDTFPGDELCIVPGVGAISCFSSKNGSEIDRAFWFHDKEGISILAERFFFCLNTAKPLLKLCPPQKSTEFQQFFVELEEAIGDKYVFKKGLSSITLPLDLYEKYQMTNGEIDQEIYRRVFLHKRRLDSFQSQIRHYKYRDICFLESLERLVDKLQYSFDEYYMLRNINPDAADIKKHLNNLIDLLQKYNNYELAIVSKKQFEYLSNISWSVKDGCSVLILLNSEVTSNNSNCNSELNYIISKKNVVNAFRDYFYLVWNGLPEYTKNKSDNILLLKKLVNRCGAM